MKKSSALRSLWAQVRNAKKYNFRVQMVDHHTGEVETEGTAESFRKENSEDESVLEALEELAKSKGGGAEVPVGTYILRRKS